MDSSFPGNSLKRTFSGIVEGSKNLSATEKTVEIEGASIHVVSAGKHPQVAVLLLHGAAFSSETWVNLGTLIELGKAGFYAIAIDLPNYGKSTSLKTRLEPVVFLEKLIQVLDIKQPIIISPSLSGTYSIPFILKHGKAKASGYIPVAPVISDRYAEKDFQKSDVPTLIIYGEKDSSASRSTRLLSQIPNSKVAVIPNGQHPAYLDDPKLFHSMVIKFIQSLK